MLFNYYLKCFYQGRLYPTYLTKEKLYQLITRERKESLLRVVLSLYPKSFKSSF